MTDTQNDDLGTESTREQLPFRCEWEVGVCEAADDDEWEFYHPLARSEQRARELAEEYAREDGFDDPSVYQITGPYKPDDVIRVGREMINEVFG